LFLFQVLFKAKPPPVFSMTFKQPSFCKIAQPSPISRGFSQVFEMFTAVAMRTHSCSFGIPGFWGPRLPGFAFKTAQRFYPARVSSSDLVVSSLGFSALSLNYQILSFPRRPWPLSVCPDPSIDLSHSRGLFFRPRSVFFRTQSLF